MAVYVGAVCFPAGHIGPDAAGDAVVSILDTLIAPASAFGCQDLDLDLQCGEFDEGELGFAFCGSLLLSAFFWNPAAPLLVAPDGPIFGNALFSPCGTLYSGGTLGSVSHS